MASIWVPFPIKQVGNFLRHFWDFFIDNHSPREPICFDPRLALFFMSANPWFCDGDRSSDLHFMQVILGLRIFCLGGIWRQLKTVVFKSRNAVFMRFCWHLQWVNEMMVSWEFVRMNEKKFDMLRSYIWKGGYRKIGIIWFVFG